MISVSYTHLDVYKRQGQLLGKVKYELDGEVIAEYDITAKNSVKELDFGASFMILLRSCLLYTSRCV